MRPLIAIAALIGVSACAPALREAGSDYSYDAPAQVAVVPPPRAVSSEAIGVAPPLAVTPAAPVAGDDIALEAAAALDAASANSGVAPVQASPSNPAPVINTAGISDENDFTAVSGRETIASDAERIARNRAQYTVVAPTAVPTRSAASQPNIVQYALSTSHAPGVRMYSRTGINMAARAQRKCAAYASPDQAQIAFLAAGGPQRDREGLDPDGDGYACSWNPEPFRRARNG